MPPRKQARMPSRKVLGDVPANANGKRALEEASQDEGVRKRISSGAAVKESASAARTPVRPANWVVPGRYKVLGCSLHNFDTTGYFLDVYWEERQEDDCQFYARFKFDRLVGVMRMHPQDKMDTLQNPELSFEDACKLDKGSVPGAENATWMMKYRAKDGGMRLDKLVGGEYTQRCEFLVEDSRLLFVILYESRRYIFQAVKEEGHESTAVPEEPWRGIEAEWKTLEDLSWKRTARPLLEAPSFWGAPKPLVHTKAASASQAQLPKAGQRENDAAGAQFEPNQIKLNGSAQAGASRPAALKAPKRLKGAITPIETLPEWAFDVEGLWKVDASSLTHDLASFRRTPLFDRETFTMELKYANNANNQEQRRIGRQLWATFKWGKMKGCIRLCPKIKKPSTLKQFQKHCKLEEGVWPSAGRSVWNFRWRGNDVDINGVNRMPHADTDAYETQLEFSRNEDGSLKLAGRLVGAGKKKARKFSGVKVGPGVPIKADDQTIDNLWKSLRFEWGSYEWDVSEKCKGAIDDSSESESEVESGSDNEDDPESEPEIDWDARRKEREAEEAKEELQKKLPWPTTFDGLWEITPTQDHGFMDQKDPKAPRFMKIYYEDGKSSGSQRQYFAEFQFGYKWSGVMRLCPGKPHADPDWMRRLDDGKVSLQEFEKACILKDGVIAGPPPNGVSDWLFKWRGTTNPCEWDKYRTRELSPPEKMTSSISFQAGEDGRLAMRGVTAERNTYVFFKGVRIGDGTPRGPNDPSIATLWEQKQNVPPPPPALWPWNSKLPKNPIEEPPPYAWDILGRWKIAAPEVAENMNIEGGKNADMSMFIEMDNTKAEKNNGRQLWATVWLRPKVIGVMRLCPLPENTRPAYDVSAFEAKCGLGAGVWPGHNLSAPGKSFQKWAFRWRAQERDGDRFKDTYSISDTLEHSVFFERDEDGTMSMSGIIGVNYVLCLWEAVKISDAIGGSESPDTLWKAFARRK